MQMWLFLQKWYRYFRLSTVYKTVAVEMHGVGAERPVYSMQMWRNNIERIPIYYIVVTFFFFLKMLLAILGNISFESFNIAKLQKIKMEQRRI